ncbi:OmpA family protein [Ekhidna sp.]|uniref:OmpA family protein n=1 Tax=Ekhidna sp. TaxID=2608089 RepID=UPI0032970C39
MKQIITAIVLLWGNSLMSQGITLDPVKKADKYFEEFSYSKAAELYKAVLLQDDTDRGYVTDQIALSYKNLNDADSSEVWFKKAIDLSSKKPANYFFLGEALMINSKYEEARYWFEEYQKARPDDPRAAKKLKAIADLEQFNNTLFNAKIETVGFNSPGLDFSPAFYKEGIVFVSSRPKNNWVQKEFNWDQSRFLDIYIAKSPSEASYFSEGLNTPFHEGPLVFYNNYQSVVFTRNNYEGKKLNKDEKGVTNLKLFFASWNQALKTWDDEQPFAYNDDRYSNGSPAISTDGNVLIFASDMPGGFGQSDLYISFRNGDTWSEPQNLGSRINTKGRDGFPFLDKGQLFFTSDGHEGLGGLDIYSINFSGSEVLGKVRNVGAPFNSSKDDFGLILKDGQGYFTSNRVKSMGDDIYSFQVQEPLYVVLIGEVFDLELNKGLDKSDVFFKNDQGEYLYTRSNDSGEYMLRAPLNSSWNVYAGKHKYDLVESIDVKLTEGDTIALERIFLTNETSLKDSLNLIDATLIVDTRIKPHDETSNYVDEFGNGDTLKFDRVYFDLDQSNLREKSKEMLNRAANFMIEHVDVTIILSSHTDSRASDTYNSSLSGRRSNAVSNYLIEMGVNAGRIQKINLGESALTNNCEDDVECSETEHQFNRRTEISFIKKSM